MVQYIQCPSCNRERNTLAVFPTNHHCHACGYHELIHGNNTMTTPANKPIILPSVESFDWTTKHIPSTVLDLYGVGIDSSGRIVSPHYSPDMRVLAYHSRTPGQRDFRTTGANVPLGLHTLNTTNSELIICEGHTDTYSAKVMFPGADVIGVPGSDTVEGLRPYLSKLRRYKRITVMTDGDVAGAKCADALIALLPPSKTYRCHLMDGTDVSDYLVGNRQDELYVSHKLATANLSGKFVTAEDCERFTTMQVVDRISTGILSLDEMLDGGFDTPSLTLLAGYTGIGKSALTQGIAVNVAKSGMKVMYLAGEMTPKQTLDRLVRQWYGGPISKDNLVDCYKEVAASILITKFTDITLANVTSTMEEAVLDHDVRLIIVDVLSDVDGFLQDNIMPAKIIKAIYKSAKGSSEVPPCAVFCVAHTKGNDEGRVRADSIRGGTAIRQEATCIIGFSEEEQGNMKVTNRIINLFKQRASSDDEPITEITLQYSRHDQRYTDHCTYKKQHHDGNQQQQAPDEDGNHVRLVPRGIVPLELPFASLPPQGEVPVHSDTEGQELQRPSSIPSGQPTDAKPTSKFNQQIRARLLLSNEQHVHRDKGDTQSTGQTEVPASSQDALVNTVQTSGTDVGEVLPVGTIDPTQATEQLHPEWDDRLWTLQRMYQANPSILREHQSSTYKTNDLIRDNLIALGYTLGQIAS